jgi:hypothetical protein
MTACLKSEQCIGRKVEIIPEHGIIYSRYNANGQKHGTTVIVDYKENSKTEIQYKNGVFEESKENEILKYYLEVDELNKLRWVIH